VDTQCSHKVAPAVMVRWEPTSCSLPALERVEMGTGENHCSAGGDQMDLPHFSVLPSCPEKCAACLSCTTMHLQKVFLFLPDTTCSHMPLLQAEQTALSLSVHIMSSRKTIQLLLSSCVSQAITSYLLTTQTWLRAPPQGSIQEAGVSPLLSHPAPGHQNLLFSYTLLKLSPSEEGNRMSFSCLSQAFFPALK